MAQKSKTQKASKGVSGFSGSSRKMEVIGLLIIAIGVLIALCIITYVPNDYAIIHNVSLKKVLTPSKGPSLRVQNGLGVVGAYLSHIFVYLLFGYPSLVIPVLIVFYGWYTFRSKPYRELNWQTVYGIYMMLVVSTFIGWFYNVYHMQIISLNGFTGQALARILRKVIGFYGSFILLSALFLIGVLFLVDRDIQTTIDRFKEMFAQFNRNRAVSKEERARIAAQRKEGKKRRKEEKRKQKQARIKTVEEKVEKTNAEGKKPLDYVAAQSEKRERERIQREKEDSQKDYIKNRAILDKNGGSSKNKSEDEEDKDDVGLNVYVGKGEEEAGSRDLEKQQKSKEKESPVIRYKFPTIKLLDTPPNEGKDVDFEEINEKKLIILDKLKRHNIEILSIDAIVGPTVTLYELTPSPDVKISKIESYANDLKMAMATHGLRIIAPIPGKSAVGIEVPNNKRETVYIKSVINTRKFVDSNKELPIAFGKTIENEVFMIDLAQLPHLLIAGATGSGKSVGINTIITCLLYKCHPENLKFVLIDPKKIELSLYRNIESHFLATLPDADEPIITDTTKVLEVLNSVCKEMDERYELLKKALVRDLKSYNKKFKSGQLDTDDGHKHLPYIVVVIDELADLMITAGKKIEEPIARIAQLARAVGIHMVIATQRPSVNVITGTIKANFPARIAYQVASKVDSRTIIDTKGADQLVGKGDMLFSGGGPMVRIQNAFVSTEEVERITSFIGEQRGYELPYHLPVIDEGGSGGNGVLDREERDDLFEEAAKVVVLHQQGSVSLLQRKLRLGYNRAGRIIDQLYNAGVVGPYQGSTARDVLVETEEELDDILRNLDD
ncbi:MAG TPA: DNA translocase FtsK [Balneolales bacterium]|nr:DNA translocase FtsK [Balneolales bacterium]